MPAFKKERVQIGIYTVKEPTEWTQHTEYAAYYIRILVQPGEYPLMGTLGKDGSIDDTSVCVKLPGVIQATDNDKHIGEDHDYHSQPYSHQVARNILEHPETTPYTLGACFKAVWVHFTSFDGQECVTTQIEKDGEK